MSGIDNNAARSWKSDGTHGLALVTAWATAALLFIGGLVTSKGVGLAVPDWPTTFGHNMFLFPWSGMVGGVFYEHGHRLFASGVGLLTASLALVLWVRESRAWVRWLGVLAFILVVLQGVLGGLRVVLLEQVLAVIHGCLAQTFFALMVSLALFTSEEWRGAPGRARLTEGASLRRLALLTVGFIYLQVVLGAVLRFTGTLLEAHLLVAFLVAVHVFLLHRHVHRTALQEPGLKRGALFLGALLILQLALGTAAAVGKFAPWGWTLSPASMVFFATTHLVVGGLMLGTSLVLALRAVRLAGWREPLSDGRFIHARAGEKPEGVSA
ncbi:MAG TPA: COX15/CtaA family protein [Candidatus Binatia bacterium]